MKIYISKIDDSLSLERRSDYIEIECSQDVYMTLAENEILYLHEMDGIYYDKEKQEVRFKDGKENISDPLVLKSLFSNAASGDWQSCPTLESIGQNENSLEFFWLANYMRETAPEWKVEVISQPAATLVAKARIEAGIKEVEACFLIGRNYMPLYNNIYSIVYSKAQESMWVTTVICTNLTSARIVKKGSREFSEAFDFITKYRTVMAVERTPLVCNQMGTVKYKLGVKVGGVFRESISLSRRYQSIKRNTRDTVQDNMGKELVLVSVSGFVRSLPYGPGIAERKLIWIDGFTRTQWVRSGVNYISVNP